jgi:single-strand DNA-binding protein
MNINRVVLTGNLTKDPDMRSVPDTGLSICKLRLAVNTRRKNNASGNWEEKPNYFDVTVFGRQAESCGQYLTKGRPVAIDGRLDWREYGNGYSSGIRAPESDIPADTSDFETTPVAAGVSDDDIPF